MEPVLPDYSDRCITNLVPALLGDGTYPTWLSYELPLAKSILMLVIDGLGLHQFEDHRDTCKSMNELSLTSLTTVAPSTTASALTSITTGLPPSEHGIVGYRVPIENGMLNTLRWSAPKDVKKPDPYLFQKNTVFAGIAPKVVTSLAHEGSGFTKAHLRDSRFSGYIDRENMINNIIASVEDSEPFVYAYWDGVDHVAHEFGFGEKYEEELSSCDQMVSELLDRLPTNTAILITADHGQVEVGERMYDLPDSMNKLISRQSGEARFRWLHALPGADKDLFDQAHAEFGKIAWIKTQKDILNEEWLGPNMSPEIQNRLGDVALVAKERIGFTDPAEIMPIELITRHGSLTKEEIDVPLFTTLT